MAQLGQVGKPDIKKLTKKVEEEKTAEDDKKAEEEKTAEDDKKAEEEKTAEEKTADDKPAMKQMRIDMMEDADF